MKRTSHCGVPMEDEIGEMVGPVNPVAHCMHSVNPCASIANGSA